MGVISQSMAAPRAAALFTFKENLLFSLFSSLFFASNPNLFVRFTGGGGGVRREDGLDLDVAAHFDVSRAC